MARAGEPQLAYQLGRMILEEPVVRQGIRVLQSHCLAAGLSLHFGRERIPATSSFQQHIEHYYVEFCRQAIESFMAVGFAPYRIVRMPCGARVPEILPLGTFSWYVARQGEMATSPWITMHDGRMPRPKPPDRPDDNDESVGPLLRYEVSSAYCKEPIRVYAFVQPSALFSCASPLVAVLPTYHDLCCKRLCVQRADVFNSQPGLVLEEQDRTKLHEQLQSGSSAVTQGGRTAEAADRLNADKRAIGGRQLLYHTLLEEFRERSRLPDESVTLIAPVNFAVHSLDKVVTPLDVATAELAFSRRVASALGLPDSMLLQGANAVGAKSASMGSGPAWSESAESSNRQLLDTCRYLIRHLELLLLEVYESIYGESAHLRPVFRLVAVPTFSLEQIMTVWNSKLIDDGAFSTMLEASWGAPLGENALAARIEQRKAEFELPFRDRAGPKK